MQKRLFCNTTGKAIATITCAVLLLVSQAACTSTRLPPYEATYTVKLRGIKIRGLRKFEQTGENTYKLSWSAKKMWMRLDEWSEFKVVDDQVIPLSYHYTRKGLGTDRPIHINFDWEAMSASASKGKKQYTFALEPAVLDRLSFQVQMQIDLLENRATEQFDYRIANYKGLKQYLFTYQKSEVIESELGEQETLVYERRKRDGATRLWISPEQHYLPIKIENVDDGDRNVMYIRSWESESIRRESPNLARLAAGSEDSPMESSLDIAEDADDEF